MALARAAEPAYGIARLIGEGYGKPDGKDETPIDIQYAKIAEWLGIRKHLPTDWRKRLQVIQAAASAEMKSLPSDFGPNDSGTYFAAKEIRDKLAGSADKSLFGGLKGSAGAWDKIVKAYEKQSIHLAEAGNTLIRNVDFEIPYFKKLAEKLQHQIADQEHKHEEYLRSAEAATKDYNQECSELGIKGKNIPKELAQLQQQLPGLFQEALADVNSPIITSAMDHYAAFTAYAHSAGSDAAAADSTRLLVYLHTIRSSHHLQQPMHRTMGEATPTGLLPDEADSKTDKAALNKGNSAEIQWDVAEAADKSSAMPEPASTGNDVEGTGNIDWDFAIEPPSNSAEADASPSEPVDISWDIDITEAAEQAHDVDPEGDPGQAESSPLQDGLHSQEAAWPESVLKVTEDSSCRTALLDDLYELNSFLLQQIQELTAGGHEALASAAPESLQRVSLSGVQEQSQAVAGILSKMANKKVQQLLMIKTSKQYSARLQRALHQKGGQHDKLVRLARELRVKQSEQEHALQSNAPKLQALVQETGRIKTYVEQAISALYNGRQINIIGEINNVL